MNENSSVKKKFSRKIKFLISIGILLAICLTGGIYSYIQVKKKESSFLQISMDIFKDGGIVTGTSRPYTSIIYEKLGGWPPANSKFWSLFPVELVITGVEFNNSQCKSLFENDYGELIDLIVLTMNNAGVTDKNSIFLTHHPKLERLNLSNNDISDITISRLEQIASLKELNLSGTRISSSGLEQLIQSGALKNLNKLDLSHTKLSTESLKKIADLPELSTLLLNHSSITDEVMKSFANNDLIHTFELTGTDITDQSADLLLSMKSLNHLNLSKTKMSAKGLAKLSKKYPWVY